MDQLNILYEKIPLPDMTRPAQPAQKSNGRPIAPQAHGLQVQARPHIKITLDNNILSTVDRSGTTPTEIIIDFNYALHERVWKPRRAANLDFLKSIPLETSAHIAWAYIKHTRAIKEFYYEPMREQSQLKNQLCCEIADLGRKYNLHIYTHSADWRELLGALPNATYTFEYSTLDPSQNFSQLILEHGYMPDLNIKNELIQMQELNIALALRANHRCIAMPHSGLPAAECRSVSHRVADGTLNFSDVRPDSFHPQIWHLLNRIYEANAADATGTTGMTGGAAGSKGLKDSHVPQEPADPAEPFISYMANLADTSTTVVLERDRSDYECAYVQVLRHCAATDSIVGGTVGMNLLLGRERSHEDNVYHIWTQVPFKWARELGAQLLKYTKYVKIITEVVNWEIKIEYKLRPIAVVHRCSSTKYYDTQTVKSWHSEAPSVRVFGPSLFLIDIYHILYRIDSACEWKNYVKYEQEMWALWESSKTGGRPKNRTTFTVDDVAQVRDEVLALGGNTFIVGDWLLHKDNIKLSHTLQIVTDISPEQIIKHVKSYKLTYKVYDFEYNDYVLKRVIYKAGTYILFESYNSTAYEAVVPDNLFMLIRFRFIDLLIMKSLENVGLDRADSIARILSDIDVLHKKIRTASSAELFPTDGFVGTIVAETLWRKATRLQQKIPPYYPALHSRQALGE